MKKHTDFSPSSFERRYLCPASYLMEKDLPSTTSIYAEHGTMLHKLVTDEIRNGITVNAFTLGEYLSNLSYVKYEDNPSKDLIIDCIMSFIKVIKQLDKSNVILDETYPLPFLSDGEKGTVDLIVTGINKDGKNQIHVIDFKFGRGVQVEAYMNYQLLLYAKGYIESVGFIPNEYDLHLHIFQPTFRDSCWSLSEDEKQDFIINNEFYKNVVSKCKELEPEFAPNIKACRFCKAKASCKPLARLITTKDKNTLKSYEIKEILDNKELIGLYMSSLEDYVKSILLNGGEIEGYCLVDDYSNRKWIKEAEEELVNMLGDKAYNIKKNIIGIGQADKLLSKETIDELTEKKLLGKKLVKFEDKLKNLN